MSDFATSPLSGEGDDQESTRVLTVSDVLNALDSLKGEVGGHAAAVAEMLAQQEAAKAARYEARQDLLRRLADEPHRFGFFAAVRLLENAHPGLPRVGTSLLTNVGLSELIAKNEEDFVHKASGYVQNRDTLVNVRRGLRARMQASPLMNGPQFAREFSDAMRTMWKDWCDRQKK